ncbi:hypothetical protein GMA19_04202 [Paenibacillus polymyxa E681]|uniref:hypothetical protein n=1 Tax=Paenibacillus polymyxa TaxID=1406 RepID=UPI0001E31AF5|nr:hypothetical protein [Paenibacillus polymyxa]ADM71969.1 hypothetical protein PPE_04189 [Paenibacillus polymyxa E681]QNV59006.1 hypothetical protein GE561_04213 [Paenibacillus polymyxa E681]QNV63832.1 hypothetical protein GMA19_04202 [Paenibacillus polymyxa E681]
MLKIMPPLTVSMEHLAAGCDIIKSSMQQVISQETQDLLVSSAKPVAAPARGTEVPFGGRAALMLR